MNELLDWVLKRKAIIKLNNINYITENKVNTYFTFYYELMEINNNSISKVQLDDMQLELNMIDTYKRIFIRSDSTTFKLPNKYGIFTMAIKYYR